MNKQRRKKFRVKVSRTCQITKCTASEILKIAHIVPRKTAAQSLREWGVEPNSDKNMLLLVSALEDSFDKGHFCLLLKSVPGTGEEALAVKILNKSIKDVPIQGTELKFKDLEDSFLDVCGNVPSHRCIAEHSYYSLAAAVKKGWIELHEYFDLLAQIKNQSPEQDKIARVQEWLRSQQGCQDLDADPLREPACARSDPALRAGDAAVPAKRSLALSPAACPSGAAGTSPANSDAQKRHRKRQSLPNSEPSVSDGQ